MWRIEKDPAICKWLKRNKGNSQVVKRLKEFVEGIDSIQDDPRSLFSNKIHHAKTVKAGANVWEYELNDSYRLLCAIDYNDKIIRMIKIGDHKTVLGRD